MPELSDCSNIDTGVDDHITIIEFTPDLITLEAESAAAYLLDSHHTALFEADVARNDSVARLIQRMLDSRDLWPQVPGSSRTFIKLLAAWYAKHDIDNIVKYIANRI